MAKERAHGYDWEVKTLKTAELSPGEHFIKTTRPLSLKESSLEIDPYLLGAWLGDGNTDSPGITSGSHDVVNMRQNFSDIGLEMGDNRHHNNAESYTILGVRKDFVGLNLLGNKHIPKKYLRASYNQRLAVIQGLMDTDGTVAESGQCEFTTTLPLIRDGFSELLRSVGVKAVFLERDRGPVDFGNGPCETKTCWQFSFTPCEDMPIFRLERHLKRQITGKVKHSRRNKRHGIVSIEQVKSEPVKCLTIDSPNHLFLAGESMIPTHNSSQTETITLAPKSPFIAAEGQIEGHEEEWATANTKNHSVLQYKPTSVGGTLVPTPQRNMAEPPIMAITQALMNSADDLKSTTGIYDAALGNRSNETSGVAIQRRNVQAQTSNFHYVDNLSRSLRHLGRILIEIIPVVYDMPRAVRIIGEDDRDSVVKIHEIFQKKGKETKYDFNLGTYDVAVETGPSYATKRQEAADSMIAMSQHNPQFAEVAGDLMVKAMDWPGSQEIADRLRKLLPPGIAENDDDDKPEMPPEAMQQMQQMNEMIEELTKNLNEANEQINTKSMELSSNERIAFAKIEADLKKTLFEAEANQDQTILKGEIGAINERLKSLGSLKESVITGDVSPGNYARSEDL